MVLPLMFRKYNAIKVLCSNCPCKSVIIISVSPIYVLWVEKKTVYLSPLAGVGIYQENIQINKSTASLRIFRLIIWKLLKN